MGQTSRVILVSSVSSAAADSSYGSTALGLAQPSSIRITAAGRRSGHGDMRIPGPPWKVARVFLMLTALGTTVSKWLSQHDALCASDIPCIWGTSRSAGGASCFVMTTRSTCVSRHGDTRYIPGSSSLGLLGELCGCCCMRQHVQRCGLQRENAAVCQELLAAFALGERTW
eukprot:gnl/TRDRNA2_/TRDRNA2_61476_c0_seq1.p1 gnl/TRDRNA2_/TRDRNA2_61476_c0~~gnl/TRDRNA2_/TRDRNA2_61476_c0_seq1.p1  ORF type:complete len:171 (+),score=8.52 gnl/TRDRNA2_/TRDRNA2_61476_c0_seq1:110-622(+)